jgi:hypothetical protein
MAHGSWHSAVSESATPCCVISYIKSSYAIPEDGALYGFYLSWFFPDGHIDFNPLLRIGATN